MISWAVKMTSTDGGKGLDVERRVVAQVLHQVEAGQVARRVVEVHVFRARVGAVDATGVGGGVPVVDGGVELHAGIGALPRRLGELTEQVAGRHRAHRGAVAAGHEVPVASVDDRLHELVGHPDRVVGVLVLEADRVLAVEVHVEAGVAQHACLALLGGLAPDEVLDVGMVHVEDDHLGRPTGLAPGLDGAGRGVGPPHEADRARGGAAALQELLRRADPRQVDAGARSRP